MNTMKHSSGFVRMEWAVAGVVLTLVVSIVLRVANIWINSEGVANASNILAAAPAILIAVLLVVYIIMRPFIERRIAKEIHAMNQEEERSP